MGQDEVFQGVVSADKARCGVCQGVRALGQPGDICFDHLREKIYWYRDHEEQEEQDEEEQPEQLRLL